MFVPVVIAVSHGNGSATEPGRRWVLGQLAAVALLENTLNIQRALNRLTVGAHRHHSLLTRGGGNT